MPDFLRSASSELFLATGEFPASDSDCQLQDAFPMRMRQAAGWLAIMTYGSHAAEDSQAAPEKT